MQLFILAYLASTSVAAAPCDAPKLQRFQDSQTHMGTSVAIVLYAPDATTADRAFNAAFERIGQLDAMMSDYDSDSELMLLCHSSPTTEPVEVSEHLSTVLALALDLSRQTEGAFDVTVGPLTKLWRRARRRRRMPSAEDFAEASQAVGYQHLGVNSQTRQVQLRRANMRLDLGGIAKGYAADQALAALKKAGVEHALVDAGGDIAVSARPPDKDGWIVGIAPLQPKAAPSHFLSLENSAVATSGDAWQHVELDGKRYSHILDPRTGVGLTSRSSVSVIAPTGTAADSLASAVSVLGVKKGLEFIEGKADTAALILRIEEGNARTYASNRLPSFLATR